MRTTQSLIVTALTAGVAAGIWSCGAPATLLPVAPGELIASEPQAPTDLTVIYDQPWDSLTTPSAWQWLRRAGSRDDDIFQDPDAPFSPPNVLRITFSPDLTRDSEPSVHWAPLPHATEIYVVWWMKLSPNWSCSPAGCGKVTFFFTDGAGQVYSGIFHGSTSGPPYRLAANTEWAPYGQQIWDPNVTASPIYPGTWYRMAFYHKWETDPGHSGDGIMRWWVDGKLNGNYLNVHYPPGALIEFQYAPTLQLPPPVDQFMYIDHTTISLRQTDDATGRKNSTPRGQAGAR